MGNNNVKGFPSIGLLGGSVEGPGPSKYGIFDSYLRMSPDPLTNALGPTQPHETALMEYDAMIEVFMAETNYAQAKANMEAYFEEFPPIWDD